MLKKLVGTQSEKEDTTNMAKESKSSKKQMPAQNSTDPSNDELGRLRDILFGSQTRTIENRLNQLDAEFQSLRQNLTDILDEKIAKITESTSAELSDMRRALNDKLENQESEQSDQVRTLQKKLTDQLDAQANEQATQLRTVQKELSDGLEKVNLDFQRELRDVQKQMGDKLEKLGVEQTERTRDLQAEVRQRDDDLHQEILALADSLGTKKASRQDLGEMLVDLGVRLQNGTDTSS